MRLLMYEVHRSLYLSQFRPFGAALQAGQTALQPPTVFHEPMARRIFKS